MHARSEVASTLLSVAQKRGIDQDLIQKIYGNEIPLMEVAGFQIAQAIWQEKVHFNTDKQSIVVLCGPGNNGGDGWVIARWLHTWGVKVAAIDVLPEAAKTTAAMWAQKSALVSGVRHANTLEDCFDICIDAMVGSGNNRSVTSESAIGGMVQICNARDMFCIAVDVPTGVRAECEFDDRDQVLMADITYILGCYTHESVVYPWAKYYGKKRLLSLGFETSINQQVLQKKLVDKVIWTHNFPPALCRPRHHKNDGKKIVFIGGAKGMQGAGELAIRAAYIAGASYVYWLAPDDRPETTLQPPGCKALPEVIYSQVADSTELEAWVNTIGRLEEAVWLVGPGLPYSELSSQIVQHVIRFCNQHGCGGLVLDAGALQTELAKDLRLPDNTVLTPHPGEAARLVGVDTEFVTNNRIQLWHQLVETFPDATVLLKGQDTLIGNLHALTVLSGSAPALATAGTGDLLAGLIAGALTDGHEFSVDRVVQAAWLHQHAGARLSQIRPGGWMASEVLETIRDLSVNTSNGN